MAALLDYKCPNCGARVEFDSASQRMKCPYCDSEFDVEALSAHDEALNNTEPDDINWQLPEEEWTQNEMEGMRLYRCNSCGGEIVVDATTAATVCPYCDNPVVMVGNLAQDLKPDYIVPFKLDKEAAKSALRNHFKGKKLLPKVFASENHLDEIKGLYVPFWLFGGEAEADLNFDATQVRSWRQGQYMVTETSHFAVERGGTMEFEHVPVDGASKLPDDMMESLEPYDFSQAVPFMTGYLSGYMADRYDVSAEESVARANERIKTSTVQAFSETVMNYATANPVSQRVQIKNGKTSYALYPVWLLNTTWRGKKYVFAMNGQTGKFVGDELPTDNGLYWKYRLLYGLGIGAALYGILWLTTLM
ncbi:MAG: hypothetical protein IJ744_00745 [Lachnospiraceae bacterium]|nr:hypothetical protein [Lachnospiraceae bacterium]